MTKHSHSPTVESLLSLRKHKLACVSLLVLVTSCTAIVFAPWFVSHDPVEMHPWLGAQAPGFKTPECLSRQIFELDKTALASDAMLGAKRVEIKINRAESLEYRLNIRRGRIKRIVRTSDAESLAKLQVDDSEKVFRLGLGDEKLILSAGVELVKGERVPASWPQKKNGAILFIIEKSKPENLLVELSQGKVTRLSVDGMAKDRIEVRGGQVQEVRCDGEERVMSFLLGTDEQGRDLWGRLLYGGRISLLVGVAATLVSIVIGVLYGALSGFLGGRFDRIMMSAVDILYAIPFIFLVILLLVLFGRDIILLFVALGALQWLTMARIVRGQVLSLKQREFVEAARMSGTGFWGIVFRHLIPNTIGPIIVFTTLTVPAVILEESFLSYIGLQVQYQGQNLDSWGALVQQGVEALGTQGERSWLLFWPSLAMATTLLCLNALGDGLRDAFDPQLKGRG